MDINLGYCESHEQALAPFRTVDGLKTLSRAHTHETTHPIDP